ncbi:efflux RND transporter periplasmic adaptor subunit [Paludibacter sp. 221]|uniref:efflux RND transporter periplasmic adaptor subunit n=1 Tax=Paludibacter sp. 221 TaxID=2302939 RepID=UPI0013D31201|nr:efflux RND transporter periplasmic adaptor subunit [Paludibacter sp. 221]NDV46571.1 efflux RND transporter periplasmic adaptor subunit [Paludibacter sp. 221]
MKKKILLLGISLSVLACGNAGKEKLATDKEKQPSEVVDKSTPVKVVRLEYSDFTHDMIANGTVSSRNKVDLRFLTSERIVAIYVKNGDKVNKGQKIAELDRTKLENSLLQANDNFERAKLELQDVLIGQGYILRDSASIPADVMALAKIRSNYDQSLINRRIAELNLKNAVLTAPFQGVVANLFSKTHNYPNAGEAFCTIIDNRHLDVDFNVLEVELPFVQRGDIVSISPYAINNWGADGRIVEINPVVDKNGMVRVKASLQASDRLYEGMNVRVLIQQKMNRQLVIPKGALVLRNNRKVVFTLRNGQANWVYVETGAENSYGYVIADNSLQVGDSIIYDGNINLAHESRVTAVVNE